MNKKINEILFYILNIKLSTHLLNRVRRKERWIFMGFSCEDWTQTKTQVVSFNPHCRLTKSWFKFRCVFTWSKKQSWFKHGHWDRVYRVVVAAVQVFLSSHVSIRVVFVCLDNDIAMRKYSTKLTANASSSSHAA